MKLWMWLGALLLFVGLGDFARADAPNRSEANSKAEQAAYDKAKCVQDAITIAGRVFYPDGQSPDQRGRAGEEEFEDLPPVTPEVAKAQLDAFQDKAQKGVRACLTESEVYDLGRYSYLEDFTIIPGSGCHARKAPATRFGRTPNNNEGDLVNGAVKWVAVTDNASISAHPFFKGQSDARAQFSKAGDACAAILSEFGPKGSRLPGLVR